MFTTTNNIDKQIKTLAESYIEAEEYLQEVKREIVNMSVSMVWEKDKSKALEIYNKAMIDKSEEDRVVRLFLNMAQTIR